MGLDLSTLNLDALISHPDEKDILVKPQDLGAMAGAGAGAAAAVLQKRIAALEAELREAREVIEFYAGKPGKSEWQSHVCDSYSGIRHAFDWDGNLQEEPFDLARAFLDKQRPEGGEGK